MNKLIEQYPNEHEAHFLRCHCKVNIGDLEDALKDSDHLIQLGNSDKNILWYNAFLKVSFGKLMDAEIILKNILNKESKDVGTLFLLGFIKLRQYDLGKAIFYFDEAIKISPEKYESLAFRGLSYAHQGKELQALSDFENIPLYDKELQSHVSTGKGILCLRKGNLFNALNNFDKAIEIFPNNPTGYYFRGIVKIELKDPTAEDDFLKANKSGGDAAGLQESAIYMYLKIVMVRDISKAMVIAAYGIQKLPESALLWESLSSIQFYCGEYKKSLESANRSILIIKENENAWYYRLMSKFLLGDREGCEEDFVVAFKMLGDSPLIYYVAGLCEYLNISLESYIEKALSSNPNDPRTLFVKGGILYQKGEKEKGMDCFRLAHENGYPLTEYECKQFSELFAKELSSIDEKEKQSSNKVGLKEVVSAEQPNIFQRDGDIWLLKYNGGEIITLKDSVGLRYIKMLLVKPHHPFQSTFMVMIINKNVGMEISNETNLDNYKYERRKKLDSKTMKIYKDDLVDSEAELQEMSLNDEKYGEMEEHTQWLKKQLYNGQFNEIDTDDLKTSTAVRNAINRVRKQIKEKDVDFGEHLINNIDTGLRVIYRPPTEILWSVG